LEAKNWYPTPANARPRDHALPGTSAENAGLAPLVNQYQHEPRAAALLVTEAAEAVAHAHGSDAGLDPLRDRDDFRWLMLDVTMPADPFAP
jgi:hypothetical protein